MNPETLDLLREALAREDCPEDLRGAFADLLMTGSISPSHFSLYLPYGLGNSVWYTMYIQTRNAANPYNRFGPFKFGPEILLGPDEEEFARTLRYTLHPQYQ